MPTYVERRKEEKSDIVRILDFAISSILGENWKSCRRELPHLAVPFGRFYMERVAQLDLQECLQAATSSGEFELKEEHLRVRR